MDSIPTAYIEFAPDTLERVRKDINMDKPGEMKEAVKILDEWVKQQPHFMEKEFGAHYLEISIVVSKGSIERAKRIIENMCAVRTLRPEYFQSRDPREYYELFKNNFTMFAIPTLTSENYRVIVVKAFGKCNNDILDSVYKYAYSCLEYVRAHDYHSGVVFIVDDTELDLTYLMTHTNFLGVKNCLVTVLDAYGMRLKRFHLITSSKTIHVILSFFKQFFSTKIFDRVVVHEKLKDLLEHYPKEVLPKEYGGTQKTIPELQEMITNMISTEEHLEYMKKMSEAKIDRSLLPVNEIYDPDNVNGSFRSLNID